MSQPGGALSSVVVFLAAVLAAGCMSINVDNPAGDTSLTTRGRYLVSIMDCGGCHTPGALTGAPQPGRPLAGSSVGFATPAGTVFPPNLTPDRETGLGRWTDREIIRAVKGGQSRDGRPLLPVMPWPSYAALTEDDARALVAYLRTLPPVSFRSPPFARPGEKPGGPYLTIAEPK